MTSHVRRVLLAAAIPLAASCTAADAPPARVELRDAVAVDTSVALGALVAAGREFGKQLSPSDVMEDVAPRWALAGGARNARDAGDDAASLAWRPRRPAAGSASRAVQPPSTTPGASIEQRTQGTRDGIVRLAAFDGLGASFEGPQGRATLRNPSDNSLAVGRHHVVQTVNSRLAVFSKRGGWYPRTGDVLVGPVPTNILFRGFGGPCEERLSGDAVVRYDQLAHRWLFVLPIFTRVRKGERHAAAPRSGEGARASEAGQPGQPGGAAPFPAPPPAPPAATPPAATPPATPSAAPPRPVVAPDTQGVYAMCYAVSASDDPLGRYYRYEFVRPLFPDYPRPAVWPDGYYVPTSTGDDVVQKHACVAERARMLAGKPAREQCVVIDGVNFLNNADLDGTALPPPGTPNVMLAAGGTQLAGVLEDEALLAWSFHVDWDDPSRTRVDGPTRVPVAPYRYLCGGQLTSCVPQPGTDRRLDAQGDKLMARVVYRRHARGESIVAVHSVATAAGGGGVRWYEFRLGPYRQLQLHQQGTFAPDSSYRWMASPAMDRSGNIAIGYSFGGTPHFAGQRVAARRANDPPGQLTLREVVLAEGEASQTTTLRWEDYTQTAVDPSDDCTIWYVGDYLRKGDAAYSTRIGAFRVMGCGGAGGRRESEH